MVDLNLKFVAEKLGKSIENAAESVQDEVNLAIKNLTDAAYANIIAHVQGSNMGSANKQDYLKSIKYDTIGENTYLISLEGAWPNKIEEGMEPYDMKPGLLGSKKIVGTGSRAGESWVRTSKKGKKYAAVPFEHKSKAKPSGDLGTDLKTIVALNRQGKAQSITKTFKDDFGKPITGKVATASGPDLPPNLQNLTKFQHVSENGRVSNVYMTWRMVHEDSSGWMHPGHPGYHFFDKVEKEIEAEIKNIINTLL